MSADAIVVDTGRLEYLVRGSHRRLVPSIGEVAPGPETARPPRGLVVVPVSRPEPQLAAPARLAAELGWQMLLICSRRVSARQAVATTRAQWPTLEVVAADLLHRDMLRAPRQWACDGHPSVRERLDIDTNRKRNLGLAAARMIGRSLVLFVDDDIVRLSPAHVREAVRRLLSDGRTVASWPVDHYPDNSVVHHARRDFLGLHQDVFCGAGALLVRLDGWVPPGFPPIYNEDWLFLFDPIAQGLVLAGPDVGQLSLDPYANPRRAWEEEFGDVLGEGLYHLLHEKLPVEVALERGYWTSVHAKRSKLVQRIIAELRVRLAVAATEGERRRLVRALAAIEESRKQLTRATPASLADFVRRWRHDEELWREYLTRLPQRDTLKEALVHLGLHESWIVSA